MENEIKSSLEGPVKISKIHVSAGELVDLEAAAAPSSKRDN